MVTRLAILWVLVLTVNSVTGCSHIPCTVSASEEAVCPLSFSPVCGCNGRTYSNECLAEAAGVLLTTPGACLLDTCPDPDTNTHVEKSRLFHARCQKYYGEGYCAVRVRYNLEKDHYSVTCGKR